MAKQPPKPEPDASPQPKPRPASLVHEASPSPGSIDICVGRWAAPTEGICAGRYRLHCEASNNVFHAWQLVGRVLSCACSKEADCHGWYLIAIANALQFEKQPCPRCKKPVHASPIIHADGIHISEYWRCLGCKAHGFHPRGELFTPLTYGYSKSGGAVFHNPPEPTRP